MFSQHAILHVVWHRLLVYDVSCVVTGLPFRNPFRLLPDTDDCIFSDSCTHSFYTSLYQSIHRLQCLYHRNASCVHNVMTCVRHTHADSSARAPYMVDVFILLQYRCMKRFVDSFVVHAIC